MKNQSPAAVSVEMQAIQTKESVFPFAEALFLAGNEHRYQKRLAYLFSLQRISLGFLFTAFPFLFAQPKFQCRPEGQLNYVPCDPTPDNCLLDIMPVPGSDHNLVTQFGLYCDYASYGNMAKNLFTAGCTIGILLIIPLADKVGRRPGLILSYILGAISVFMMVFSDVWSNFAVLLTVAGLGLSPYLTNSFLLFNEASGPKMRAQGSVLINSFWTLGQVFVGVLAYILSNNWRNLILIGVGLPLVITLPFLIMWTKESAMYLASKKKFDDARNIIKKIGEVNNRHIPEFEFSEEHYDKRRSGRGDEEKNGYGFSDLLRYRSLRKPTLITSFLCFAIYFNYYGTIFALSHIQVNKYFLTVILAITELVAYYVSGIMLQKVPRTVSFALCSTLCCLSNMLFVFFPVPENHDSHVICYQVLVQLALSMINRFSVSIAMSISGTYVNEIFPTSVRAIGTGLIIFVGRLGSFMATIVISICLTINVNPILIFGLICLPAILASMVAKETKGLPLPEYIEEERQDAKEHKKYVKKRSLLRVLFDMLKMQLFAFSPALYKSVKVSEDPSPTLPASPATAETPKHKVHHYVESEYDV